MASSNDSLELVYAPANGLIISISEARKILGKKSAEMTDDEVEALIVNLQFNAEASLLQKGS